ncbi:MAG: PKD domain-containing protein [Candidatus Acetothermia bacterium]
MVEKRGTGDVLTVLLVAIAVLLTTSFVARGQLDVTAVTPEREAPPDEFVSLTYSVTNNSESEQDIELALSVPDGWSPMGSPSPTTLGPGERDTVFVTVQVPATAEAGEHPVTLEASYDGDTYTGTATVTVTEVQEISITEPAAKTVGRDSELSYVFTVKNTGNVTDTFEIEADSGHDWVTDYSPETMDLFPGASKEVEVNLYVPEDASPGRDPVSLTVTSSRDEDIKDSATVYTRILPPSPQAVGGELYAILPARLEGSFNRGLGDQDPSGSLNLIGDGELGNGDLYFDFGLSDLYTDNDVEWNALDYSGENYRINSGNVGYSFSDLIDMSGRGWSASLTAGNFGLSLLDLSGSLKHSGGQLSYEDGSLYLAGNLGNISTGEDEYSLTESVVARYSGEEATEVELEAGYTPSEGEHGYAYEGYTQLELEPLTLEGEAFFIGPRFAGQGSGDKGFRLSQSAGGENFSQNLSYSYFYSLPGEAQTESTVLTDRLSANARLDVLGATDSWPDERQGRNFNISGSATLSNRKDTADELDLDESSQRVRGSIFYRYDYVNFSVSATREVETNNLSDQTFEYFNMDQSIGFDYEGISFTASFSNSMTDNLTTGNRVSSSSSTGFTLESGGEPYVGLSITKRGEQLDLDLDSTVNPYDDLELSIAADASIGGAGIDFGGSLDFTYEYDLPLEFIVTKGRIEGNVFIDENENGKKDEGEEGVEDLVLTLDDTEVATGEEGFFRFPPFKPGTYELDIPDLPRRFGFLESMPKEVKVERGEVTSIAVPLTELASIELTVYSDDNQDGSRNTGEDGISGVKATLSGEDVEERRTTGDDGVVTFRGLVPGAYTLTLDENTLPPRSVVTTENAETELQLQGGEQREISVGSFQEPREVVFGQPPEPDFAFSPEEPEPGDQVNFSGGLSEDPDGEITSYEWDFTGDGEIDQTGMIVSHTFDEPGTYEVELTVVDDDDNEVSVSKELQVSEAGE